MGATGKRVATWNPRKNRGIHATIPRFVENFNDLNADMHFRDAVDQERDSKSEIKRSAKANGN